MLDIWYQQGEFFVVEYNESSKKYDYISCGLDSLEAAQKFMQYYIK